MKKVKKQELKMEIAHDLSAWKDKESRFLHSPIFAVACSDCAEQSYIYSKYLFEYLEKEKILSSKYEFLMWLKLEEDDILSDYNGGKFQSLSQCFEHTLLAEHKKRGLVLIYISPNIYKKGYQLTKLLKQVKERRSEAIYLLISNEENMKYIVEKHKFIQTIHNEGMLCTNEMLFGSVWNDIDAQTRMLIEKNETIFQREEVIEEVRWTINIITEEAKRYATLSEIFQVMKQENRETNSRFGFM